jgi:hypothetical protein
MKGMLNGVDVLSIKMAAYIKATQAIEFLVGPLAL